MPSDKSEADYEDMLRAEHKELLAVPPAPRSVVGKMYLQRAKGDWEVRVVLTCLTWRYTNVKMKKEEAMAKGEAVGAFSAEMSKILNTGMKNLFERFPDLDPDHKRRQIGKRLGSNAVTAYVQVSARALGIAGVANVGAPGASQQSFVRCRKNVECLP